MSGVKLEVQLRDEQTRAGLERIRAAMGTLKPLWQDVGEYMLRSVERRFQTEAGPDGTPWAQLSARTLRKKRNTKILTESTRLRNSIVYKADDDQLEVGTNVIYAAIHQLGGTVHHEARTQVLLFNNRGRFISRAVAAKRKRATRVAFAKQAASDVEIPARPFLGVDDADERKIKRIVQEHLAEILKSET